MAFLSDQIGSEDERVRLELGGEEVLIAESYQISVGVFTQPNAFALQLGWGDNVQHITKAYPPNTPFKLYIGKQLQQTGLTDGYRVVGNRGAPAVHIRGRDAMVHLFAGCVPADTTFANKTYRELVEAAMKAVKFPGSLIVLGTDTRNTRTGVKVKAIDKPLTAEDIAIDRGKKGATTTTVKAGNGESWLQFLTRELAHAGLFLWASAYGDLVLSRPSADQQPTYRITRTRQRGVGNQTNIVDWEHTNETTGRFSEVLVQSRAAGKKEGRVKVKGAFDDLEMQALGYDRPLVLNDYSVADQKSAERVAIRKLAESRRQGYTLSYQLAGHKTDALFGGRAVWAPDTVVDVQDDDLGIHGPFWIADVNHTGGPMTNTAITLVRPGDVFFDADE